MQFLCPDKQRKMKIGDKEVMEVFLFFDGEESEVWVVMEKAINRLPFLSSLL
jgi:hypothetical protein